MLQFRFILLTIIPLTNHIALKNRNLIWILCTGLFLFKSTVTNSCTIFIANDGQQVWIGNNEDELADKKYRFWYYPAHRTNYGYTIWTELSFGKLLNGFSYLNPQGGLNESGLFIDFTAIDPISVIKDNSRKDRKKQVVTDLLKKCKSVDEALAYLHQYNLIKLSKAQLFIADSSGNYAIVTGGYIVRKTTSNFVLSNYPVNNGYTEACHRRDVANYSLQKDARFDLDKIKAILAQSSQYGPNNLVSNYSMAVNLKTSTIHLYYKSDFRSVTTLSLKDELKKGKHHRDLTDYFPRSVIPVLEKEMSANGISAVLAKYRDLRKNAAIKYNFNNNDAIHLAVSWIEKGAQTAAIQFLFCLQEFDPQNPDINSWLGVAYRKNNNIEESKKYFNKALQQDPENYVAILYGKQENQKVEFKLSAFEGAKEVFVMGDFTNWTKHPVPMQKENGYWTCQIILPKGELTYKFIVNKQYLADHLNFMHTGKGPDIYSKLYVW